MALNLCKSGIDLVVWNRSEDKCKPLQDIGASVANSPVEVFDLAQTIFLMLADSDVTDLVLGRDTPAFAERVSGRTVVNMGTTSAEYSCDLEQEIFALGGVYIEAPVFGARKPAETGQLMAMVAGDPSSVEKVLRLIAPMCAKAFACGPIPSALTMKLSVNLFLITMVTGLAESAHFAERHGLNMAQFFNILDAGPMASSVSRIKTQKLIDSDFSVQASIADVLKNNRLVVDAARLSNLASPLLDVCHDLYCESLELGHGQSDMVAVVRAIEARSEAL